MSSKGSGELFIVSSASGAGKTTLCHRLRDEFPALSLSISYTTRKARGRERDGVDYHFIDVAQFEAKIQRNDFAEYARVHDNLYGTSIESIEEARGRGLDLLFEIDVQGARQLQEHFPDAVTSVFVLPPSLDELERRLRGRGTDRLEVIERRLAVAKAEMSHYGAYDYVIINDELDRAYDEIRAIYVASHLRRARMEKAAREVLAGSFPR